MRFAQWFSVYLEICRKNTFPPYTLAEANYNRSRVYMKKSITHFEVYTLVYTKKFILYKYMEVQSLDVTTPHSSFFTTSSHPKGKACKPYRTLKKQYSKYMVGPILCCLDVWELLLSLLIQGVDIHVRPFVK